MLSWYRILPSTPLWPESPSLQGPQQREGTGGPSDPVLLRPPLPASQALPLAYSGHPSPMEQPCLAHRGPWRN